MVSRPVIALVSMCFAFLACGGSTSSSNGGTDDGGATDATTDGTGARGDGGCFVSEPVEGSACSLGQTICDSGNACCRGYAWSCETGANLTTGTWKKLGLGCACVPDAGQNDAGQTEAGQSDAGPFGCGSSTCNGAQYCQVVSGGAQLPDGGTNTSSQCIDIPPACASNPTCDCIKQNGQTCGDLCSVQNGHIEVQCLAP
jgi:hypothetical protein